MKKRIEPAAPFRARQDIRGAAPPPGPEPRSERIWKWVQRYGIVASLITTSIGFLFTSINFLAAQDERTRDHIADLRAHLAAPGLGRPALGPDIKELLRLTGGLSDLSIACPPSLDKPCSGDRLEITGMRDDWFPGERAIVNVRLDQVDLNAIELSDSEWRYFAIDRAVVEGIHLHGCYMYQGSFKYSSVAGDMSRCTFTSVSFEGANIGNLDIEHTTPDVYFLVTDNKVAHIDISGTKFCFRQGGVFGLLQNPRCANVDSSWLVQARWTADKPPIDMHMISVPETMTQCRERPTDPLCHRLSLLNGWGLKRDARE